MDEQVIKNTDFEDRIVNLIDSIDQKINQGITLATMHMQTSNFDDDKKLNTQGQFLDKYDTQFVLKDDFIRQMA